ncbi:S-type pyocin domain-containing protein [Pseudomonas sp. JDS28PS106]|uniref:S-type pyocin domain-containing protein n=1 Tax=Pseudomonas sp. JDS28PS106 TaxID=2497235 RepID=UPI002FD2E401
MRLLHRSSLELRNIDKRHVVAPEKAVFELGFELRSRHIDGLEQMRQQFPACNDEDIRAALRRGEWLLIKPPTPFLGTSPQTPPPEPPPLAYTPSKEPWPRRDAPQGVIFAKSCAPGSWGKTEAGTEAEPAGHFGNVMVAKSKPVPAEASALAASVGATSALGRLAGGGIFQSGYYWLLRTAAAAGAPVAVFVAGMLPARMGDGTLYSDDELRAMNAAASRVRFQFRRDAQGQLQLYGIHTGVTGDDTVPTVKAQWTADHRALQADLGDGITIIWTPNNGPLKAPELVHPQAGDERLNTILVHPIAEGTDTQIEVYPEVDDITLGDRIITFPAESGLRSLYVVFSKALPAGHSYHQPPKFLQAFPDAVRQKHKSSVQGGGKKRARWKDRKGRILEWDSQHGRIELYDKQGKHLGEYDPVSGEQTKPADAGRRVEK